MRKRNSGIVYPLMVIGFLAGILQIACTEKDRDGDAEFEPFRYKYSIEELKENFTPDLLR